MPDENNAYKSKMFDIYELYRTSLMNSKYYGYFLKKTTSANKIMEIVIAVGATGSGVAGWNYWGSAKGQYIWALLAGSSAVLAIVKPIIGLGDHIKLYSEQKSGYQQNFLSLKRLCKDIQSEQIINDFHLERYKIICDRHDKLEISDVSHPNLRRLEKFQDEVNREIPSNTLWWPKN